MSTLANWASLPAASLKQRLTPGGRPSRLDFPGNLSQLIRQPPGIIDFLNCCRHRVAFDEKLEIDHPVTSYAQAVPLHQPRANFAVLNVSNF